MTKTKVKEPTDELFEPPPIEEPTSTKKNEVAVRKPAKASAPRVVPETSPVAVMEMIERVASNPTVNPDNLEKLLSLQERILDRQAKLAFNEAFVVMAPELPAVTKDGRIVVREKTASGRRDGEETQNTPYAKWETISPAIVPILSRHGFSIRHRTESAPDGKIRIVAVLYGHGHEDTSYMDFELDSTGSKNNAQARVSATTYGRRITACALINLVGKGEDDDGKSSGRAIVAGEPLSPEELQRLTDFLKASECPEAKLVTYLNERRPRGHPEMKAIADLPASRFEEAAVALTDYAANRKAREAKAASSETR